VIKINLLSLKIENYSSYDEMKDCNGFYLIKYEVTYCVRVFCECLKSRFVPVGRNISTDYQGNISILFMSDSFLKIIMKFKILKTLKNTFYGLAVKTVL